MAEKVSKAKAMRDEGVKITLDKKRELRFDLNALEVMEDQGISLDEAFEGLGSKSIKMCKILLFASLAHEEEGNENFTPKFVGQIVNIGNFEMAFEKLTEALEKAMPEADEKQGNETGK